MAIDKTLLHGVRSEFLQAHTSNFFRLAFEIRSVIAQEQCLLADFRDGAHQWV